MSKLWRVMEIFGPTIQGEGTLCGQATHFIRFGGCGYRCSWCDSMYAVDPKSVMKLGKVLNSEEIEAYIRKLSYAPWITLSGGDPCLHKVIPDFLTSDVRDFRVAVETQGQHFPPWLEDIDLITFSPKPPSARQGNTAQEFIDAFRENCFHLSTDIALKIVVEHGNLDDWAFVVKVAAALKDYPLYLQPMTQTGLYHHVVKRAMIWSGYNWLCKQYLLEEKLLTRFAPVAILPQLHVMAFDDGESEVAQGFRVDIKERV